MVFWRKYSANHEFPLSASSSVFLHLIGFVLVGGFLLALFGLNQDRELPVDTVSIGSSGDNPRGVGDLVLPSNEAVEEKDRTQSEFVVKNTNMDKLIKPLPKRPDRDLSKSENPRPIDTAVTDRQLVDIGEKLRRKVARAIDGEGGDRKGKLNQREKRQLRWTMIFNTRSGEDYADQLKGLGAILAIPGPNGVYLAIRDPDRRHRPVQAREEDLKELNRIYWVDDKPQSVHSLAMALGIRPEPDHIVAFFPESLEKELLEKEMKAFRGGNEDDIEETTFKVERLFGRFVPVVEKQKSKQSGG
jgi:hypothetical protein